MWKRGISEEGFEKLAQGLSPDNEALPYSPEFDKNTTRINQEILNLESNMKNQFRKNPRKDDPEMGDRMNAAWDLLYDLKQALYSLDSELTSLDFQ